MLIKRLKAVLAKNQRIFVKASDADKNMPITGAEGHERLQDSVPVQAQAVVTKVMAVFL